MLTRTKQRRSKSIFFCDAHSLGYESSPEESPEAMHRSFVHVDQSGGDINFPPPGWTEQQIRNALEQQVQLQQSNMYFGDPKNPLIYPTAPKRRRRAVAPAAQRTQPGFRHRRDEIVKHAALTEQRMDAALGGVGLFFLLSGAVGAASRWREGAPQARERRRQLVLRIGAETMARRYPPAGLARTGRGADQLTLALRARRTRPVSDLFYRQLSARSTSYALIQAPRFVDFSRGLKRRSGIPRSMAATDVGVDAKMS